MRDAAICVSNNRVPAIGFEYDACPSGGNAGDLRPIEYANALRGGISHQRMHKPVAVYFAVAFAVQSGGSAETVEPFDRLSIEPRHLEAVVTLVQVLAPQQRFGAF